MVIKNKMPPLSIIVCCDEAGGFGKDGKIPWNIPEDMKYFKETTKNNICIMGRKTYENMYNMVTNNKKSNNEIIKNILVDRTSFVITSDNSYKAQGVTIAPSIRAATQQLDENDHRKIFVIGGLRMFIEALTWTNLIYMTVIKNKLYDCDKHFPVETLKQYKIISGKKTKELYFLVYKKR